MIINILQYDLYGFILFYIFIQYNLINNYSINIIHNFIIILFTFTFKRFNFYYMFYYIIRLQLIKLIYQIQYKLIYYTNKYNINLYNYNKTHITYKITLRKYYTIIINVNIK